VSVKSQPQIEAYIGMTGSGKGVSVNRRLAELQPARLLVWDPRAEYEKHARKVDTLAALRDALKSRAFRLRYVPGPKVDLKAAFGKVCEMAFAAGGLVFIAEELSDVTQPSWAPPAWKQIITQGRHQDLIVFGCAQRPALVDKNFLGNATMIRVFMLGYEEDSKAMAKAVRAPLALVDDLFTNEVIEEKGVDIRYLEYTRRTRTLIAGEIRIRNNRVTEKRVPYVVGAPQKAVPTAVRRRGAT
jgi:hypothetical protein